ncbi:MAG: TIGR02281 family clan AA aspartic protease [Pseudomonadota bacterium]
MGRIAVIIIVLCGIIAAMLPAGPNAPSPTIANHVGGTFSAESTPHVVRGGSSFSATTSPNSVPGQGITLDRAPDGHFYADAQVNGTSIRFLVDTGASGVALSAEDARRAGLPYFSSEFTAVGRGASGEVRGKLVTLDRVTLGGKSVENVSGAILEGSEMSLLGQSFLGRMGSIEITGDRMVIR